MGVTETENTSASACPSLERRCLCTDVTGVFPHVAATLIAKDVRFQYHLRHECRLLMSKTHPNCFLHSLAGGSSTQTKPLVMLHCNWVEKPLPFVQRGVYEPRAYSGSIPLPVTVDDDG